MAEDKQKRLERFRRWRYNNPESYAEANRRSRKRWRERHPDLHAEESAAAYTRNPKRTIFRGKRQRAKAAGIPFTVGFDEIQWPETCPALGTTLDYTVGAGRRDPRVTPSFDRLDPSLGYVPGNVVVVSMAANIIKNQYNAAEIRAVADWLDSLDRDK